MARKLNYDITRFDGGMSDDIRVSDLSKCAFVSHFNIYCDPHKLIPMPGYVADQDTVAGGANDLKNYSIRAFYYDAKDNDVIYAVGETSGGGGSKLFQKDSPSTASWTATTNGEGTDDLATPTTLFRPSNGADLYYATTASGTTYLSMYNKTTVTDKDETLESSTINLAPYMYEEIESLSSSYDIYFNRPGFQNVSAFNGDTYTAGAKSTSGFVYALASGQDYIGIFTSDSIPQTTMQLWDANSILSDRTVDFGKGRAVALDYVANTWIGVVNEGLEDIASLGETANGSYSYAIKYADGELATTIYRGHAATNTNADIYDIPGKFAEGLIFYLRRPLDATPTTYDEGIYCVARCKPGSPIAVSKILDTASLGSIQSVYSFGNHFYFAHAGDGSVSRLDSYDGGTYDVDCTYDTLMFGHDTPFLKEFKGIAVVTEDLPSGAEVEVFYRFNENDSWTTLGTSSTAGAEIHNFTRAAGVPIGRFREIQFRVQVTGKAPVKGVYITLHETDDLPWNH